MRFRFTPVRVGVLAGVLFVAGGCRPKPWTFPASINSPRPEERAAAVRQAVDWSYASDAERRAVLEMLVGRLEDEDPAVRFFAIIALEKMTGTRLGYVYHAPLDERLRAVQSWRRYMAKLAETSGASAGESQLVGGVPVTAGTAASHPASQADGG